MTAQEFDRLVDVVREIYGVGDYTDFVADDFTCEDCPLYKNDSCRGYGECHNQLAAYLIEQDEKARGV